jgi:hypothetical protein
MTERKDKGPITFVSEDHFQDVGEKVEMVSSGRVAITSRKQLEEMGAAAARRFMGFQISCSIMTMEQAAQVRQQRAGNRFSWRDVAYVCYLLEAFRDWEKDDWWPPNNQLIGMTLCEKAAEMHGENYRLPPWN